MTGQNPIANQSRCSKIAFHLRHVVYWWLFWVSETDCPFEFVDKSWRHRWLGTVNYRVVCSRSVVMANEIASALSQSIAIIPPLTSTYNAWTTQVTMPRSFSHAKITFGRGVSTDSAVATWWCHVVGGMQSLPYHHFLQRSTSLVTQQWHAVTWDVHVQIVGGF